MESHKLPQNYKIKTTLVLIPSLFVVLYESAKLFQILQTLHNRPFALRFVTLIMLIFKHILLDLVKNHVNILYD